MRPLSVLTAIIFGSSTAISFGLVGVAVIFLILKGRYPQMSAEFPSLVRSSLVFIMLAGISGVSLLGLLKEQRWRWWAQGAMWAALAGVTAFYLRDA